MSDLIIDKEKQNIAMRNSLRGRDKEIDMAARGLANFVFREGPIEDMHSNKQLSQKDMEVLNKFIVNRLAYALGLIYDGKTDIYKKLILAHSLVNSAWDVPIPDDGGFEGLFKKV